MKPTTKLDRMTPKEEIILLLDKIAFNEASEQQVIERIEVFLLCVRETRIGLRLKLRDVEEKTGISNAYLSQLENGKIKNPSWKTVRTLYCLYHGIEFQKVKMA